GVRVPGLNEAPRAGVVLGEANAVAAMGAQLWPALSGWPIAAVLVIVWSLYAFVALLVIRVARVEETAPRRKHVA
ncbi:MAG TPA: hypothetical protein VFV20_07635, partial [Candidatus Limnocylindria bacterium]|nr:hypothetical protein [Candidatus Limnocylindria bacterium]